MADILRRLGGISADRVLANPPPGTATEEDLIHACEHDDILCELVDGILVVKAMGYLESAVAAALIHLLRAYVRQHGLGVVLAPGATLRYAPGLVRLPDVSFISWERIPDRKLPRVAMPSFVPDLAVEVISPSNTEGEMARKLREYFGGGTRLVWIAYPDERVVRVYTRPDAFTLLTETDVLDGEDVVPGFRLCVGDWFDDVEDSQPAS